MIAWVNAGLGLALAYAIGVFWLGLPVESVLLCILGVQISGFVALFSTTRLERIEWIKRRLMNRSLKTWAYFLTVYFGGMLWIAPPLREGRILGPLILPLILSNGLTIIIFGPLQDVLVRKSQNRARRQSSAVKTFAAE
jgi:hypothetical protein